MRRSRSVSYLSSYLSLGIALVSCLFLVQAAEAKVRVNINGTSNGEALVAQKGPLGINHTAKVSQSGGSISSAKARAHFNKRHVTIGNKVESAGTSGDTELTHVRAGSLFAGTATFHAPKGKKKVKNFTIDYAMEGNLRCKTSDDTLGDGYSMAVVETDVIVDGGTEFSGTATQDGSGTFSDSGDLSGQFSEGNNSASIDKTFELNLGTLRDKQKLAFEFIGSTLVSYGAEVPISYCEADFYKTSTFEESKASKGKLTFTPATPVTIAFDPTTFDYTDIPDTFTVYVESTSDTLIENIDSDTVTVFAFIGDNGSLEVESMDEAGDYDSDGKPDRALHFSATELTTILLDGNSADEIQLFLSGQTTGQAAFVGKETLALENF